MTTPLAPDKPGLSTFGGPYRNADNVEDATTEMDAAYGNRLLAQVVMLSRTAPIAWVRCTVSGGVVTIEDHDAVWGNTNAVKPTVTRTSAGIFNAVWASSYPDMQEPPEPHSVSIRTCSAMGFGATSVTTQCAKGGTTQATALFENAAGVSTDPDEFTIFIW